MGKFYWLKLKKDIFKRHDLINLRSQDKGLIYEAIFIHMMTESIDHEACLRYSEKHPYTAKTLAPIVGIDPETMKEALEILEELELIEILEDGTIFVPLASENIGSAEDNDNANRQRRYRERQAVVTPALQKVTDGVTKNNVCVTKSNADVTQGVTNRNESIEYRDIEKDIRDISKREKEKEREKREEDSSSSSTVSQSRKRFIPPTVDEVRAYCIERNNGIDPEAFVSFYASKNWYVGKSKMVDWKASIRTWEQRRKKESGSARTDVPIMEKTYSEEDQKQKESLDWLLGGD